MNSLCIPRAMYFTQANEVMEVFNGIFDANIVDHIDERETVDTKGQNFKSFYIHFNETPLNSEMIRFNDKMERDGVVQVMTGKGKWFWKVYVNRSPKAKKQEPTRVGPRIMTEEDEEVYLQWKQARNQALEQFTEEELDELDEASGVLETYMFTEDEIEELDEYNSEDDLMAIADEMANE